MEILIAEDDPVSRHLLAATLKMWGYTVVEAEDGEQAWAKLTESTVHLAVVDWMMPKLDGIELFKRIRSDGRFACMYLIMLTTRSERDDLISGLDAGADDYVTKPFNREELRSRIQVGVRVANLQKSLAHRVAELEALLVRVKQLEGLLPICSYCMRIRDKENDQWKKIERYIAEHSSAEFSHGICPECYSNVVEPELLKYTKRQDLDLD